MNDRYSELKENHFGSYYHDDGVQQKISKLFIDMIEIYPEKNSGSVILTKTGRIDNHDGTFGIALESHSVRYESFDLKTAVLWMNQNDWTIRSWLFNNKKSELFIQPPQCFTKTLVCNPLLQSIVYPGIRAYRGKIFPIRSGLQIKEIREGLKKKRIQFYMEYGTESKIVLEASELLNQFFDGYSLNLAFDCFDFLPLPR